MILEDDDGSDLDIRVSTEATNAVSGLGKVDRALSGVSSEAVDAARDVTKARRSIDDVAGSSAAMASKTGTATGALGALAGGLEAVGLGKYAAALETTAVVTDVASGASDLLTLALESSGIKAAAARVKTIALTAATRGQAAAQRALNLVMRANPLGIVITVLAALGVAVVAASRKSQTFRDITNRAFQAVATAGRWLWNNVLQPVFSGIVTAIGKLLVGWGKMLQALGKVPGFGWAKAAGDKMVNAGTKAQELGTKITKIPGKRIDINDRDISHAIGLTDELIRKLAKAATIAVDVGGTLGNGRTAGRSAAGLTGPGVINLTVNGALDPVAVARQIVALLRQYGFLLTGRTA